MGTPGTGGGCYFNGTSLWDSGVCCVLRELDRQGGRGNVMGLAGWFPAVPVASVPEGQLTCRRKVIGCWPMAWASPMLARMTSVNGFLIP